MEWSKEDKQIFRELIMRANLAFPESTQDLVWFEEKMNTTKEKRSLLFQWILEKAELGKSLDSEIF